MAKSRRDPFYQTLRDISVTPSPGKMEGTLEELFKSNFSGLVDSMRKDPKGNIYVVREGGRPGKIMFSAHQDKRTCHESLGGYIMAPIPQLDSNLIFTSEEAIRNSTKADCWVKDGDVYRRIKISSKTKTPGEIIRMPYLPSYVSTTPTIYNNANQDKKERLIQMGLSANVTYPGNPVPIIIPQPFSMKGGLVTGKMDDALGLSLIIDLFRKTKRKDTPTLIGLLTVEEETGKHGSEFASKHIIGKQEYYTPDKIIVLDTSSSKDLGEGLVLYHRCGSYTRSYNTGVSGANVGGHLRTPATKSAQSAKIQSALTSGNALKKKATKKAKKTSKQEPKPLLTGPRSDEPFAIEIQDFAEANKVPLHTTTGSNDCNVFGRETDVPTIALEVPIEKMHSVQETCAVADIELMRKFLGDYILR
jgi:putative aminopeptidase FrvX